ncbi:MAG: YidC/Oxa1 family membrane protein insertase [Acidimicrobiia bacterium]|nr:YidC/Oxa1 family membrane protein insertase [Acidimicrobiia bacterium]
MFDLIANLLSFFYDLNNSYAVAIALLTLVVLVISTPLTLTGTKSMLKMQLLQPELKEIQNKYGKDEREAMNAEMMEFYKSNNINPVGGCIPMLFQIPVFLVLYRVILGITRRATDVGTEFGEVAGSLAGGSAAEVIDLGEKRLFNPAYVGEDSQLFKDLSDTSEMNSVGFDLARSASQVLGDGIVDALPYLLLVLVVGVTGWVQHQMIRKRQTGAAINPTQEMIMKFMPFFLPVFSFTLPAAIVIYFLISNLYRIAQQYYITRSMYHGDDSLGGQLRKSREDGDTKGGGNKGSSGKGGGGNKSSNAKSSGNKGSGAKAGNNKNKNKSNGSGARKNGSGAKTKSKTSSAARTSAPGRNSSGRQASARASVQPKARKKKKR